MTEENKRNSRYEYIYTKDKEREAEIIEEYFDVYGHPSNDGLYFGYKIEPKDGVHYILTTKGVRKLKLDSFHFSDYDKHIINKIFTNSEKLSSEDISYSEYIGSHLDNSISYAEYINENLSKTMDYTEYIAENIISYVNYEKNIG